ncbi:tyrosine-type recombinase/integrase [Rossellomorea vietnamensis]|uniref:Tyrosine-type recombinase/integrase n=1 Tax=Rossellomorea vietnamensis TaxID=218284 RepID=A0ACD4C3W5_9BACI|nr:tyrosine-type recombinase/integrase [Rossellomorea vietnamensis]UXH43334.1 tyrosine-type recombinase/integrase [Rossellomorea vietnamensis]
MQGSGTTIDQFLTWLEHEGKSSNTISTYHQELRKYEKWLQENHRELVDITHCDVQEYISFLEEKGKSPVTTDKILGVIRTFSKFLKKPDITFDIKIKQGTKKDEIESLSKEECEVLLREVRESANERNIAIVYMLLHTGIRVSELCALDIADIDLETKQVSISDTHGADRIIPLSEEVVQSLSDYMEAVQPQEALFVSKTNERLTERSVQYMLKKYHTNAQKLRHTFCQHLIDQGVSLEIVSKLAGHRDNNVTKRYAKSRVSETEFEHAIRRTFSKDC